MSACISRHGEYSGHNFPTNPPNVYDEFTCERCGVLSEYAMADEIARLRSVVEVTREDLAGRLRPLMSFYSQVIREGRHTKVSVDFTAIADALVGAGWPHPRVITTVTELDALAEGAVILSRWDDGYEAVMQRTREGWAEAGRDDRQLDIVHDRETGEMCWERATVLWSPPAAAGDQR